MYLATYPGRLSNLPAFLDATIVVRGGVSLLEAKAVLSVNCFGYEEQYQSSLTHLPREILWVLIYRFSWRPSLKLLPADSHWEKPPTHEDGIA